MAVAEDSHVAVYFIRDDDDAALMAEMSQTAQGVGIPTDARGVVGIGEDEHAAFGVADGGELGEVHCVGGGTASSFDEDAINTGFPSYNSSSVSTGPLRSPIFKMLLFPSFSTMICAFSFKRVFFSNDGFEI